jgi:hypothetical protein
LRFKCLLVAAKPRRADKPYSREGFCLSAIHP